MRLTKRQTALTALHSFCVKCRDEAKTLLAQRMDATVNKVQAELEDKKSLFTTSKNDLELRIKLLQEQIQCLDELIKADETLWA